MPVFMAWRRWSWSPAVRRPRGPKKRSRLAAGRVPGKPGAGRAEERQGTRHGQADDVVEAALGQRAHEAVGALLDRVAAGLVPPLAAGDVVLDLARGDGTHRDPGALGVGEG